MTKEELLEFVKIQFEQSGEEFGVTTAFDIFLTSIEKYVEENIASDDRCLFNKWIKKMWAVYLQMHEV